MVFIGRKENEFFVKGLKHYPGIDFKNDKKNQQITRR
jgi:hypothetical protein